MSKNKWTFIIYFVELCTYITPNIFDNVKSREIYKLSRELFCFIWSPVAVTNSEEAGEQR